MPFGTAVGVPTYAGKCWQMLEGCNIRFARFLVLLVPNSFSIVFGPRLWAVGPSIINAGQTVSLVVSKSCPPAILRRWGVGVAERRGGLSLD